MILLALAVIIITAFICLMIYTTKNYDFFKKRGIKFIKPYPFIGTNYWMLKGKSFAYVMQQRCQQFKDEEVFGMFDFLRPVLVLNDIDIIKRIAIKDFDHFTDRRPFFNPKESKVVENTLIMLKGQKWHEMRTSLTPIFTSSKMRLMFELISDCAEQFVENITHESKKDNMSVCYEMKDLCAKYTCDVIASCVFGYQSDSYKRPDNDFYNLGRNLLQLGTLKKSLQLLFMRYFPNIAKIFGFSMFDKKSAANFYRLIVETMKLRETEQITRPDMINLLLQLKKGDLKSHDDENMDVQSKTNAVKRSWSEEELIAQCFVFFFAGFETVSTLLIFLTYELATNPDVQHKLRNEINGIEGSPTYDTIQGMKYMNMVVSETLRKWPSASLVSRLCTKSYQYETKAGKRIEINVDDVVFIPIYSIQHDPEIYPNPDKFDPERFSDENKSSINVTNYLPFGIGPRICIGSRFALLEVKTLIFYILSKFSLEISEETEVPLRLKFAINRMATEKPVYLRFKRLIH